MKIFFCFLFFITQVFCQVNHSIVFVHIGTTIPSYLENAVTQAGLFNPQAQIYVVANEKPLQIFSKKSLQKNLHCVSCESLKKTSYHNKFIKNATLDDHWPQCFWRYTIERFFYLDELMAQHQLEQVFHLESDNMLYVDLSELLEVFHKNYSGIGATFDNDRRCIAGFIYISRLDAIHDFVRFIAANSKKNKNDMQLLASFKKKYGLKKISYLPVIFPEYYARHKMRNQLGNTTKHPELFSNNFNLFHSIFDAAAIGQFLGGIDPIHEEATESGFINESCLFNPSLFCYEWKEDAIGRKIPYLIYKGKKYRINNLHIHSKRLKDFSSKKLIVKVFK